MHLVANVYDDYVNYMILSFSRQPCAESSVAIPRVMSYIKKNWILHIKIVPEVLVDQTRVPSASLRSRFPSAAKSSVALIPTGKFLFADHAISGGPQSATS